MKHLNIGLTSKVVVSAFWNYFCMYPSGDWEVQVGCGLTGAKYKPLEVLSSQKMFFYLLWNLSNK